MATLSWYVRVGDSESEVTSSSGVGFFGALGFGSALHTDNYNDTTFITSPDGTIQGAEAVNNKYITNTSVLVWGSSVYHHIQTLPNAKSTLKLEFTHTSSVAVENAWVTACSRNNVLLAPGLNVFMAEICHTSAIYTTSTYSDSSWSSVSSTEDTLTISDSPGSGGEYAGAGTTGSSLTHDWYLALSVSPTSGGDKTFSLYAELEYL